MGFEATAHIARPVDEVWSALTDWRRAPEWMSGIEGIAADGDATGEGTRLVFQSRGAQRASTLVGWSPPSRLALPLIGVLMKRADSGQVAALKRVIESAPS